MIWPAVVFFPLVLAAALPFASLREAVFRHGLWTAPLPALFLALGGGDMEAGVFPSLLLGTVLHFGPFGRVFLLLTALLWTAAGLYSRSYLAHDAFRWKYSLFFLLTLCGNLGLTSARDLASFYTFFALMSFAAYGLVIHERGWEALRAGRVYLTMTVLGEGFLAAAFFYAGVAGGSLLFEDIVPVLSGHEQGSLVLGLAFTGFGIKAGLLALHLWLPLAHPVAPTPASAVLSGAMIKAGLLGWLQIFPVGSVAEGWSVFLVGVGMAGAVYGVFSGLWQRDPKTMLAYSSVSQVGLMTAALGVTLGLDSIDGEKVLGGLLLFVLVHGLAKGALFLGAGMGRFTERRSLAGHFLLAGLAFASLVLAGLPFTGGAAVKQALKAGGMLLPGGWGEILPVFLTLSASGTGLLLSLFVLRVHEAMPSRGKPLGVGMILAWAGLLAMLVVAVPLWGHVHGGGGESPAMNVSALLDGLWPIALGFVGAVLFARSRWGAVQWKGCDGLLLEGLEKGLRFLEWRWRAGPLGNPALGRIDLVAWADRLLQTGLVRKVPDRIEQRLTHWHTVGVLFVALVLVFVLPAWWG